MLLSTRIGNPQKSLLALVVCLLYHGFVQAQNVAINTDGSLPNKNAMLDIKSDSKGLLIPRMSTASRMKTRSISAASWPSWTM